MNLREFENDLMRVECGSIEFHMVRGDFENWILTTLGDATLAQEVHACKGKTGEDLRDTLTRIVSNRLIRLEKFQ
jgi:hypothetical protein